MPLPTPNAGESKSDFVSRCMGNDTMNSEYPDQSQRIAVCNSQWSKEYSEFVQNESYDINDVEIFSAGKWNKDKYTEKDLDDMVEAFQKLRNEFKPYLKLGHDEDQKLLQKDGLPSAGWITGLKRKGEKLLADFKNVPKKIKELIDKKAYGRFSSEIYWNLNVDGRKFRRVLKAVALLGADTPAVSNLDDFINLYENKDYESVKEYHNLENTMSEELIRELKDQVKKYSDDNDEKDEQIVQFKQNIDDLDGQVKKLTKEIEDRDAKVKEAEKAQKDAEIKAYMDEQLKAGKILPAQVKEYTELAEENFEQVKKIIDNMPKIVEFEEESQHQDTKKYSEMTDEEKDEYVDMKATEYMKKNEVTYKEAYLEVSKELEN